MKQTEFNVEFWFTIFSSNTILGSNGIVLPQLLDKYKHQLATDGTENFSINYTHLNRL